MEDYVYMVSRSEKILCLVNFINQRYITNFKVFGYYLPFWRKMQTKLKMQSENTPGCVFPPIF